MAISSISITEERSKFVDFSEPFLQTGSTILVAKRHGSFKGDGFLRPFKAEAWLLIFAVLYLVAIIIFIFESRNPGLARRKHKTYRGQFNIHQSIWLMFSRLFSGILTCYIPRFVSSRVVLSSWSFATLMIGALYTANLAAFMVLKEQAHYIDGINDSRIQNPSASVLKFATIRETSVERYFKNNLPHVFSFMRNYKFNHSSEGVRAVRDRTIDAFIWESATLERYVANDTQCSLLTVGKLFDMNGFAAAFPKGSRWVQNVSDHILKYQQTDVQGDLREKWQKGSCQQSSPREEISMGSLGPVNIAGVFYMLGAGVALSFLVLLGETLYFWSCTMTRRDWKSSNEHRDHAREGQGDDLVIRRETSSIHDQQYHDVTMETIEYTESSRDLTLDLLENELSDVLKELYEFRQWTSSVDRNKASSIWPKCPSFKQKTSEATRSTELVTSLTLNEARKLIGSLKAKQTCTLDTRECGSLELVERESIV